MMNQIERLIIVRALLSAAMDDFANEAPDDARVNVSIARDLSYELKITTNEVLNRDSEFNITLQQQEPTDV